MVINYSGGNASAYAIRLIIHGVLPRPRHILVVFADTGSEKRETYRHVDEMEQLCRAHDLPFVRCSTWSRPPRKTWDSSRGPDPTRMKLHEAVISVSALPPGSRIDQPPVFVDRDGQRGQVAARCTRHWKIRPMARAVKHWASSIRGRIGDTRIGEERSRVGVSPLVTRWIGYTRDEQVRVATTMKHKQPFEGWLRFPGIALQRRRSDIEANTVAWGYELAPWSACVCCPHNDDQRWKATSGEDLETAVACDEAIRDASSIGITDGPAYLSDRLAPIAVVRETERPQLSLPGLTACGGGFCIS